MRLKLLIFFLLLANVPLVQGQYDPKALQILDAMSAKYKNLGTFKADFSYTLESPSSGINETYAGNIVVKNEKFHLKMGGQEIINDGNTVYTYMKETNEVNIANYEPEEGEISPTDIYTMYKKGFKYLFAEEVTEGGQVYDVIELVPEDKSKQYFKIKITIHQKDKTVKRWKIFEKNGNRYTYDIKLFTPNVNASEAMFKWEKARHPGVQIVDLR
jgi:outer membrane lipoprotein-sorting protein